MKEKLILAGKRALWTMSQTLVAMMGVEVISVTEYDWPRIIGVCIAAGILSLAKSVAIGMPEQEEEKMYLDR